MPKRLTAIRNWLILKIGPENWKDPVISKVLASILIAILAFVFINIRKFVICIYNSQSSEMYNFLLKDWTLPLWVILILCLFTSMFLLFIIVYLKSKRSGEISTIPYNYNETSGFIKEDFDRFHCFIANEKLVNDKCFEIDIFIESKQVDFKLRTLQLCIVFNPEFISTDSEIKVEFVNGSTKLKNFNVGRIIWSSEAPGFQSAINAIGSCENGTIISAIDQAIRVGKFRITIENNKSFNKNVNPSPRFILPWHKKASGLELTTSITKWGSIDCSSKLSKTITQYGTYT